MDWIELTSFEFDTIIGILPKEREVTQPLAVEISLGLDLEKAGTVESLSDSINYARVQDVIMFVSREGRWHLIEALALAICRILLAEPSKEENQAPVDVVDLTIRKPKILAPISIPGVRIKRDREWFQVDSEMPDAGVEVLPLAQTLNTWVWRVNLASGAKWEMPQGMATFVLAGTVDCDVDSAKSGDTLPPSRVKRVVKAKQDASILLVGNSGR